jgi:hypothetical protein
VTPDPALAQLLADTGLARVQALRGRGDVKAVVDNAEQVFELNEGHDRMRRGLCGESRVLQLL